MWSGGVDVEERRRSRGRREAARGRDVVLVRVSWIEQSEFSWSWCGHAAWLYLDGKVALRRAELMDEARGCLIASTVVVCSAVQVDGSWVQAATT